MVGTTLTAATLGLAALGFAGTASASSTDEAFLAQLQADGITPPSAARAIKDAHAVCDALDEVTRPKRSSRRWPRRPV